MTDEEWQRWAAEWKSRLPSPEHRRHQRLFRKSDLTDEEDLRIRGYCVWKKVNHERMLLAAAVQKTTRAKRGRRD
jgi:hypothetical protein